MGVDVSVLEAAHCWLRWCEEKPCAVADYPLVRRLLSNGRGVVELTGNIARSGRCVVVVWGHLGSVRMLFEAVDDSEASGGLACSFDCPAVGRAWAADLEASRSGLGDVVHMRHRKREAVRDHERRKCSRRETARSYSALPGPFSAALGSHGVV